MEIRRPTILHIITRMVRGGAQENTLATVLGVEAARYRSVLVTGPSEGAEGSLVDRATGADLRHVGSLVREVSVTQDIRALRALVRIIRAERPAILHTHTSKAGILGRIAGRIAKVPIIVHTPHGHVFSSYFGRAKTRLFISLERYCARFTDRLVMLTENELRDHLAERIAPREEFVTIHSGVDFSSYVDCPPPPGALRRPLGIPPDAMVIGTVGRLVPIKGHEHLIAAMPAIRQAVPNAHLALVGSGELQEELQWLARELGVADRVHFAGYRSDVAACLVDMDLFALPSLNEGMGRVLVEAMAMKLPCVASDVSGIRDLVIPDRTGILVQPASSVALSESITRLLTDHALARRYGCAGYEMVVPDYSLEHMIRKIEDLYDELLQQ